MAKSGCGPLGVSTQSQAVFAAALRDEERAPPFYLEPWGVTRSEHILLHAVWASLRVASPG